MTSTDARGNVTTFSYDAQGRQITRLDPPDVAGGPQALWQWQYDAAGRLWKTIDPQGRTMTVAYDARGRFLSATYADGSVDSVTYGSGAHANLIVAETNRNGHVTTFAYDLTGRRISTIQGADVPAQQVVETCTYLPGTELKASCTKAGETTTTTYDRRKRPIATAVQTTAGSTLTTTTVYDAFDRVDYRQDAFGRRTFLVYDVENRPIREITELVPGGVANPALRASLTRLGTGNPAYTITDTEYNIDGQVTARIDADGTRTTFVYDALGRMTATTEAAGTAVAATTTTVYDAAGNRTRVTSPRGIHTDMTYTGRSLLASVTEAADTAEATLVRSLTYTPTGKTATESDALGRVTSYTYGTCCDRLEVVTDPAGYQTNIRYDFVGNRTTVTDANGLTATTTYDAVNRPLTQTNAAGEVTAMAYDDNLTDGSGLDAIPVVQTALVGLSLGAGADGSAIRVTNPKGEAAYEIRDGLGRPLVRIDPLGHQTRMAYDALVGGLVEMAQTDALGHVTRARSDGAGRTRQQIDALGNVSQSIFSEGGDQIGYQDAGNVGWSAVYDPRHRLLSRTSTRIDATETTSWTYDLDGNRLTETDALNTTETSQYDLRNRRTVLTDRLHGITRFAYDAVGNLTAISDAENEARGGLNSLSGATQYAYDPRNLLVAEVFPTGQTGRTMRTYAYDGGRRLTARQVGILSGAFNTTPAFTGSPEATSYLYDAANRLTTRGYADAKNDTFGYDLASRLTSAASARYSTTVGRAYDAAGRLISESLALPDGSLVGTAVTAATYTVGYTYDDANRSTGITYPTGTQVVRTYTDRNELHTVSLGGSTVATRAYDVSGRLLTTVSGNGITESRTYLPGSYLINTLAAAPPVGAAATGFSYTYDAAGRKLSENNSAGSDQTFGYDVAGRLNDWKGGPSAAPTATQTWNLSLVGDWNSTTRDGVAETRQNTWVHEAVQVGTNLLTYDAKGNLTKDEHQTLLAWDPENRLASAWIPVDASTTGFGAVATYRYDALGRRVAKTVQGRTTLYLNAGAQTVVEMERTAIPPQAQIDGAESDGTAANAALTPASGGVLSGVVTRINFQPATTVIPAGFYADKGNVYPTVGQTRTNGLTYGWATDATGQTVARHGAVPLVEFDTFAQAQEPSDNAWSIALPDGSYPVVVVAGDALSRDQTNNLVIGGQAVTDDTPATTDSGYDQGNFDGYAVQVTVSGGLLTISPGTGALRAKLCFVEIGAIGTTIDQATRDKLAALITKANGWTANTPDPVTVTREYAYGSYVDEVLAYQQTVAGVTKRYYPHANHLYSVAALTDAAGQVVERFSYDAYGKQTITADGIPKQKSTVGFARGFTGYVADNETGLLHARARMYSTNLGWISRDPVGYVNGMSLYEAYMVPNYLDPTGTECCNGVPVPRGAICCGTEIIHAKQVSRGCCNNTPYDRTSQCCENGKVVDKVEYYIVTVRLFPWLPPMGPLSHSYRCEKNPDGTMGRCVGKWPVHDNFLWDDGELVREPVMKKRPGEFTEVKKVCPSDYPKNWTPGPTDPYSFCPGFNCHSESGKGNLP